MANEPMPDKITVSWKEFDRGPFWLRVRLWLIVKLAGKCHIAINLRFQDNILQAFQHPALIINNQWKESEEEASRRLFEAGSRKENFSWHAY